MVVAALSPFSAEAAEEVLTFWQPLLLLVEAGPFLLERVVVPSGEPSQLLRVAAAIDLPAVCDFGVRVFPL